ncbi:tetratricopeptide repeat protein [Tautonia rosea]|uniref:tetratricopeptide repeat protein n=1 Tax=Tautonia rosea TaxID=2728037 RepID=UPI001473FC5A|nr:tetratricopeptide repeat protein [Tautonia rosea]
MRPVVTKLLLGAAWLVTIGGAIASIWAMTRSAPDLAPAIVSYEAGRLKEAEAKLRGYLQSRPQDPIARLLLARSLLHGEDPRPQEALDAIGGIEDVEPATRAEVLLVEGEALAQLQRLDEAEAAWLQALEVDPQVAEVGWHLLSIYYIQGRQDDARQLALRLHPIEPDPDDRVNYLVELARWDVEPPAPGSILAIFEPIVRENPMDRRSAAALGLALISEGRIDEGLSHLRRIAEANPDDLSTRSGLLEGLARAGLTDELAEALDRLPEADRDDPSVARYWGQVAQDQGDWATAVEAYRRALDIFPGDREVSYRLQQVLRLAGQPAEAEALAAFVESAGEAEDQLRSLYLEVSPRDDLGSRPDPDLYRRFADLRARMGRREEALAWYQLVLKTVPNDAEARDALDRFDTLGDADS